MPQQVKTLMLAELEKKFRDVKATGCVLVSYQGMKADQERRLRHEVRQKGAEMTVVRNSIFGIAMEHLGAGEVRQLLEGPVAVVHAGDPVSAAKAAGQMTKASAAVRVRGAYFEGRVVGPEGVEKLATIPSREVLLSMVAGALTAPLRRLAYGLLAKPRALVNVFEELKKKAAPEGAGGQQAVQ